MPRHGLDNEAGLQKLSIAHIHKEAGYRHMAYHDLLTGLPNRTLLEDRFRKAITRADQHHKPLALLMARLDEFDQVNEKLGRANGDRLLRAVAARLTRGIRGNDAAYRYGGDDFAILIPELNNLDIVTTLAADIGGRLSAPYIIDYQKVYMPIMAGIAVYPGDGQTLDELVKRALHNPFLCIFCRGAEKVSSSSQGKGAKRQAL